jgi:hypothetical protein
LPRFTGSLPASVAATCASIFSTISGGALPPAADFTLKPFHSPGLWLAVIITPAAALLCTTPKLHAGVGAADANSFTGMPLAAITSAAAAAKRSDEKRVSYPTTTFFSVSPIALR